MLQVRYSNVFNPRFPHCVTTKQTFQEFANDPVYLEKVRNLSANFSHIRRTRPDGNCFYRALAFAYFEHLLTDRVEFERFRSVIIPTKEKLGEVSIL
jgi:ubiquitin thioesterase protein OTUB1